MLERFWRRKVVEPEPKKAYKVSPKNGEREKSSYLEKAKDMIELGKTINHKFMPWLDGSRRDANIEKKQGWKIHVSIHPDDYNKIAHILAELIPYAEAGRIGYKFAAKGWAEKLALHNTQRGKTITVYIPEEEKEIAPEIVQRIELAIKRNNIRTWLPAPNDEVVGETGAVSVSYTHFGGGAIKVPEEYRRTYGYVIPDSVRRRNAHLAVPLWKVEEFQKLFGKLPKAYLVLKALEAGGSNRVWAFRRLRQQQLRNEKIKEWDAAKKEYNNIAKVTLHPGETIVLPEGKYSLTKGSGVINKGTGITEIVSTASGQKLRHGNWESPMSGIAYVLDSRGYVKICKNGEAKRREVIPEFLRFTQHLHELPHIVVERGPNGRILVHNVGHRPVDVVQM